MIAKVIWNMANTIKDGLLSDDISAKNTCFRLPMIPPEVSPKDRLKPMMSQTMLAKAAIATQLSIIDRADWERTCPE